MGREGGGGKRGCEGEGKRERGERVLRRGEARYRRERGVTEGKKGELLFRGEWSEKRLR